MMLISVVDVNSMLILCWFFSVFIVAVLEMLLFYPRI